MLPTPGVKHPLRTVSADSGECEDEVQADKSEGFMGFRTLKNVCENSTNKEVGLTVDSKTGSKGRVVFVKEKA